MLHPTSTEPGAIAPPQEPGSVQDASPSPAQLSAMMQLASPALPIGAFSYSQGLEAAVNAGLVHDEPTAGLWIRGQFEQSFLPRELFSLQAAYLEVERVLENTFAHDDRSAMQVICAGADLTGLARMDQSFVASRDSAEGRLETRQLGSSLCRWLASVDPEHPLCRLLIRLRELPAQEGNVSSPVAFAIIGLSQRLDVSMTRFTWAFSWLENQVQAAVKLVPLGQSSGQRLLQQLRPLSGMTPPLQPWTCTPLASLMMMRHERQYSRLFRS